MAGRFDNRGKAGYGIRGGTAAMRPGGDTLDLLSRAVGAPVGIDLSVLRNPDTGQLEQLARVRTIDRSTGQLTPWVDAQTLPQPNPVGPGSVDVPVTRRIHDPPLAPPPPRLPPTVSPPPGPPITDYMPQLEPPMLPFNDPVAPLGTNISPFPLDAGAGGGFRLPSGGVCDYLPKGPLRDGCKVVGTAVSVFKGNVPVPATGVTTCPQGYKPDGKGGCQLEGMAPYLPGDIGRPDFAWQPVRGYYGIGAAPAQVVRPTRVCPRGWVLGDDGVCYKSLPRTHRAHDPGSKPLLTGGDMNALRRARRLQKTIGKISRQHGKKPCSCKSGSTRRKK